MIIEWNINRDGGVIIETVIEPFRVNMIFVYKLKQKKKNNRWIDVSDGSDSPASPTRRKLPKTPV